jgi:hypothetical protein
MPKSHHHRTPSTAGLIRRLVHLLEREVCRLEAHYDTLGAAPPPPPSPLRGEGKRSLRARA